MKIRGLSSAVLALTLSAAFYTGPCAAEPLRVCADPDNLPFSKSEGPERGLYIELAELVAKKINATPVQYTWWLTYFQRRALRNSVGECDAVFALPTDADYRARGLQKTAAFLDVGYALVSAPGFAFNGLDDLKGKKLGVQFQTNPHILLSQRNDLPFTTFKSSDEIFAALGKGDIEAGFLWGPVAGYDNQRLHGGKFKVTPLSGPDLTGQVSVAVKREKADMLKEIDAALLALKPEIAALSVKYGFPTGAPVKLTIVAAVDLPKPPLGAFAGQVPERWVVKAQRRYGRAAAWGVILLEAVGIGGLMYLAVKNVPGMAESWIGQQLILALVGIGLAIFVGGGLVMALGRR